MRRYLPKSFLRIDDCRPLPRGLSGVDEMNRRRFFGLFAGAAAAPVVAKLAPIPSDGVALTSVAHPTTVHYPANGDVFNAPYVWKTYGVDVGPVHPHTAALLESARETQERYMASVLNEPFLDDSVLETVKIKLPSPS